jgi:hypothetical protein
MLLCNKAVNKISYRPDKIYSVHLQLVYLYHFLKKYCIAFEKTLFTKKAIFFYILILEYISNYTILA